MDQMGITKHVNNEGKTKYYRQQRGLPMGGNFVPELVSMYMEIIENEMDIIKYKTVKLKRYIDDQLFIYDERTRNIEGVIKSYNERMFIETGVTNKEDLEKKEIFLDNVLFRTQGQWYINKIINIKELKRIESKGELSNIVNKILKTNIAAPIVQYDLSLIKTILTQKKKFSNKEINEVIMNQIQSSTQYDHWFKNKNTLYRIYDYYGRAREREKKKNV